MIFFSTGATFSGVLNEATFLNADSGLINIDDNSVANFYNTTSGTFTNVGHCYALGASPVGIKNEGLIGNDNYMDISGATDIGILSHTGSIIENRNRINFAGVQPKDLRLYGTLINHDYGKIVQRNSFNIRASGTLNNHGLIRSETAVSHTIIAGGTFNNHAIIVDKYDQLAAIANNLQVIVGSITTPLQVGVPFSPALNVVAWTNVSFDSWNTTPGGATSAGAYNIPFNIFTPFIAANGLSVLWPKLMINSTGELIPCELLLSTAVTPLVGKDIAYFKSEDQKTTATDLNFSTYPNPSNGLINIAASKNTSTSITVEILNTLGQGVFRKEFSAAELFQFDIPAKIPSGHYFLKIFLEGKRLKTTSIQLVRS